MSKGESTRRAPEGADVTAILTHQEKKARVFMLYASGERTRKGGEISPYAIAVRLKKVFPSAKGLVEKFQGKLAEFDIPEEYRTYVIPTLEQVKSGTISNSPNAKKRYDSLKACYENADEPEEDYVANIVLGFELQRVYEELEQLKASGEFEAKMAEYEQEVFNRRIAETRDHARELQDLPKDMDLLMAVEKAENSINLLTLTIKQLEYSGCVNGFNEQMANHRLREKLGRISADSEGAIELKQFTDNTTNLCHKFEEFSLVHYILFRQGLIEKANVDFGNLQLASSMLNDEEALNNTNVFTECAFLVSDAVSDLYKYRPSGQAWNAGDILARNKWDFDAAIMDVSRSDLSFEDLAMPPERPDAGPDEVITMSEMTMDRAAYKAMDDLVASFHGGSVLGLIGDFKFSSEKLRARYDALTSDDEKETFTTDVLAILAKVEDIRTEYEKLLTLNETPDITFYRTSLREALKEFNSGEIDYMSGNLDMVLSALTDDVQIAERKKTESEEKMRARADRPDQPEDEV